MNWLRRLFRTPKIPQALWEAGLQGLPFLQRLTIEEQVRLKRLSESLLAVKSMTGAGGFELTDEIAIAIAAQACLPVLNLTLSLYDDMPGIVVYPDAFLVPYSEVDEAGVVHEGREPLAGEAISAGGAVVLSWPDVRAAESIEHNVVIHEFAHVIDLSNGSANGRPPFLAIFHPHLDATTWQATFSDAYADLRHRIGILEKQLPADFNPENAHHAELAAALFDDLPLDPYAGENPAEFFAVASEAFFVCPEPLMAAYPDLYQMLSAYYRQDPLDASRSSMAFR